MNLWLATINKECILTVLPRYMVKLTQNIQVFFLGFEYLSWMGAAVRVWMGSGLGGDWLNWIWVSECLRMKELCHLHDSQVLQDQTPTWTETSTRMYPPSPIAAVFSNQGQNLSKYHGMSACPWLHLCNIVSYMLIKILKILALLEWPS